MKKILVDIIGFSALFLVAILCSLVEREWGRICGGLTALALLFPLSFAWRYFYQQARRSDW
jgi:hypothetical protein